MTRAIALLTCALLTGCATPAGPAQTLYGRLLAVIDGDTIRARVDGHTERVRLLGLDAPEVHRPHTPVQCGGRESAAALAAFARPGAPLTLTTDPTQDTRDRYGRLLAYARVPAGDLELAQLRAGWAAVYVYQHRKLARQAQLDAAARQARRRHRGVWGICGGDFHRGPAFPR